MGYLFLVAIVVITILHFANEFNIQTNNKISYKDDGNQDYFYYVIHHD